MKLLIAAVFAMGLFGASAASADVVGAHVGPLHLGVGVHSHHRHCAWRGHRHPHRVCW